MRHETRLILASVALLCTATCSRYPRLRGPLPVSETSRAVVVYSICPSDKGPVHEGTGSGVVVDANHVLTAGHVIACHNGRRPLLITATTPDEKKAWSMRIAAVDVDADIAKLDALEIDPFSVAPAVIAPPRRFSLVCIEPGFPKPVRACGIVWSIGGDRSGDVHHDAATVPGNSGAGLWDDRGHLVGIVVTRNLCGGIPCLGGSASSLTDRGWLR